MTVSHEDVNYSMALAVARLCLDPRTGKPTHKRRMGVAIRGALFTELALAGRIEGAHAPVANGPSDTGAVLADQVHKAISSRSRTPAWRRWYSHTDADVDAATKVLVEAGVWKARTEGRTTRYEDAFPDEVGRLRDKAFEVTSLGRVPERNMVFVGLLAVGAGMAGGRSRPRAMRAAARKRLLAALPPDVERKITTQAAMMSALSAMK